MLGANEREWSGGRPPSRRRRRFIRGPQVKNKRNAKLRHGEDGRGERVGRDMNHASNAE